MTIRNLVPAFVLASLLAASGIAQAQTDALPPVPGSGAKAAQGGFTGARASLAGDRGSALEPYLFLAILAGGGIIAWVFGIATDVSVRRSYALRKRT